MLYCLSEWIILRDYTTDFWNCPFVEKIIVYENRINFADYIFWKKNVHVFVFSHVPQERYLQI